jgi:hypothetical protein
MTKDDIKQLVKEIIMKNFSDDVSRFIQMFPGKIATPPSQATEPSVKQTTKLTTKIIKPKIKTVKPKELKPWIPKGYVLSDKEKDALEKMTEKQRLVFYMKKRRKARIEKGLCADCGETAEKNKDGTSKTYCTTHLQKRRDFIQSLIDKGICLRCWKKPGVLTPSGKRLRFCVNCAKIQSSYAKSKRLEYLRKNICTICHKNPLYKDPKTGEKLTICKKCSDIVKKQHVLYRKRAKLKKQIKLR